MPRLFKSRIAVAVATTLMMTSSFAQADGFERGGVKDSAPSPFSWTGFYLGATAGVAIESSRWYQATVTTNVGTDSSVIYGATAGFNLQRGAIVVGIEGDWSKTDTIVGPLGNCSTACTTSADWLATARARAGVLVSPSTLLYGTGGLAWADIKTSSSFSGSHSDTATGWVAGGGFEIKLDRRWSVKGEYLHVELDDTTVCSSGAGCSPKIVATDNKFDILRAGLNYSF